MEGGFTVSMRQFDGLQGRELISVKKVEVSIRATWDLPAFFTSSFQRSFPEDSMVQSGGYLNSKLGLVWVCQDDVSGICTEYIFGRAV